VYYDATNIIYYILKNIKLMYKNQIAQLKCKGELNRENEIMVREMMK
jgi:hypothetical protein